MKQQIEQLIDRLASKELTFGCRVSVYSGEPTLEAVLCKHNIDDWVNVGAKRKSFKILGHPILIGDVLEKIDFLNVTQTKILLLIVAWKKCGASKFLQEIFAECEWEVHHCFEATENGPKHKPDVEVPKQKPHRELFEFLLQLNLAE